MGLYEALKDAVSIAQKADNIDLYRKLLDLSAQALDMQSEIARLKRECKLETETGFILFDRKTQRSFYHYERRRAYIAILFALLGC